MKAWWPPLFAPGLFVLGRSSSYRRRGVDTASRRWRGHARGFQGRAYLSDPDEHPVVLIARDAFGVEELIQSATWVCQCGVHAWER
jgi:hypothetical protein